jgi:hypothetical protein
MTTPTTMPMMMVLTRRRMVLTMTWKEIDRRLRWPRASLLLLLLLLHLLHLLPLLAPPPPLLLAPPAPLAPLLWPTAPPKPLVPQMLVAQPPSGAPAQARAQRR